MTLMTVTTGLSEIARGAKRFLKLQIASINALNHGVLVDAQLF
jgi:hypothetical protein